MPQIGELKLAKEIGYKSIGYVIWRQCIDCGNTRWVKARRKQPQSIRCQSCTVKHWYKTHPGCGPNWKGGRKQSGGYIGVKVYPDNFFYPMAQKPDNYILEHRLIMAKHLGRCLLPWEIIHHKNGIRNDNRLENLELLPYSKYHLPDTKAKSLIKQQQKQIESLQQKLSELQKRVILLEAENSLIWVMEEDTVIRRIRDI